MDFTIYTTGSAEFLEIMLNACAMITGSGDAEDLARIGALIGLFLLAFQAVFNNQAITFGKAGLVLVLYMMFYGPTATTVIEDTVSSQVRVVDNVPLGPAFVGSVISTVPTALQNRGAGIFYSKHDRLRAVLESEHIVESARRSSEPDGTGRLPKLPKSGRVGSAPIGERVHDILFTEPRGAENG